MSRWMIIGIFSWLLDCAWAATPSGSATRASSNLSATAIDLTAKKEISVQTAVAPQRKLAVAATANQRAQLAATLANETHTTVKHVIFADLIGKTITETEKNLSQASAAAERGGYVLLFDEADALFGKRTTVKDSHDRYANIDTNLLLQKIEQSHATVVIGVSTDPALDPDTLLRWQKIPAVKVPPKP